MQGQFCQVLDVFGQQGVGGQNDVVIVEMRKVFFSRRPIQRQHVELRCEVRRFVEPVGDQASGHDHHRGSIKSSGVLFAQNVRQCLQGFTQTHVIRKDAADFKLA